MTVILKNFKECKNAVKTIITFWVYHYLVNDLPSEMIRLKLDQLITWKNNNNSEKNIFVVR